MLSVMIVDDEPLVRTGICHSIAWGNYDMQVVAEAGSVDQAIQLIGQNQKIDIIFTDVSMPNRDGLDLLRWLHQNHPAITPVILSYHNEFNYVQEALRHGAVDYILKEELNNPKFCNTISHIAEEAKQRQQWHDSSLEQINLQKYYSAVTLFSSTQKKLQILQEDHTASDIFYPVGISAGILFYCTPLDQELLLKFEQNYDDDIIFLTFETLNGTFSELILCINLYISRDFYYERLPRLRVYSLNIQKTLLPVPQITGPEYVQLERQLTSMLWLYDEDILEKLLFSISQFRLSPSSVFNLFYNVQMQWKHLFPQNDTPEMFSMANIHYWYQWIEWIKSFRTFTTTETRLSAYSPDVVSTIQNLMLWIDDNFMFDISLTTASEKTNLSPSYLSRCFKKITGYSFNYYIRNMRIGYAKKMLVHSNLPIRHIAELCGFSDQFYFDRVFKKMVGQTPGNNRREMMDKVQ